MRRKSRLFCRSHKQVNATRKQSKGFGQARFCRRDCWSGTGPGQSVFHDGTKYHFGVPMNRRLRIKIADREQWTGPGVSGTWEVYNFAVSSLLFSHFCSSFFSFTIFSTLFSLFYHRLDHHRLNRTSWHSKLRSFQKPYFHKSQNIVLSFLLFFNFIF